MEKAIVLLSGGLNSATMLALATRDGFECHALSVNYGQRYQAETVAAKRVTAALGSRQHRVIVLNLQNFDGPALTDSSIDGAGHASGVWDSSRIRGTGFAAAGIADPSGYLAPA